MRSDTISDMEKGNSDWDFILSNVASKTNDKSTQTEPIPEKNFIKIVKDKYQDILTKVKPYKVQIGIAATITTISAFFYLLL